MNNQYCGIIILNKPVGGSSHRCVSIVRKALNMKKVGHTGTLDPMATGVLPVALGGATRFIELLPTHKKAYKATFRLGLVTDTLDIWGTVTDVTDSTIRIKPEGGTTELIYAFSSTKVCVYDTDSNTIEVCGTSDITKGMGLGKAFMYTLIAIICILLYIAFRIHNF